MDGKFVLLLAVIIVVLVLFVVFVSSGLVDKLNVYMDDLVGQGDVLSHHVRQSLHPLVFKVSREPPDGFSYYYTVQPSNTRRTILVTTSVGSRVMIDRVPLVDILETRGDDKTFVGYLFPHVEPNVLEIFTRKQRPPVIQIAGLEDA